MRLLPITVALSLGMGMPSLSAESEFERYQRQQQSEFQSYLEERDRQFSDFLKSQWEEMRVYHGLVRDPAPKPVVMPVAPREPEPVTEPVSPPAPEPLPETPPVVLQPVPKPVPEPPPLPAPSLAQPDGKLLQLSFYGQPLTLSYAPELARRFAGPVSEAAIAAHWRGLAQVDYKLTLEPLQGLREPLRLNDWGYIQLVRQLAGALHPERADEQALLSWFLLAKSGYAARVGYLESGRIVLFLPTQQKLYDTPYLTFDGVRYYAIRPAGERGALGRVYSYNGSYPGAHRRLDMALRQMLRTRPDAVGRELQFSYDGQAYRLQVQPDRNTSAFLDSYPQMDLEWYFRSGVGEAANGLLAQLRPLVEGRNETEAVNLLLRFVQTAFAYRTDDEQFGYENYLFADETLNYPYSDCEDRSVIFAWLVRELLGLEVIGLSFPGHVATAVRLRGEAAGDVVEVGGARYLMADPTYINAELGMTMPQYAGVAPTVIRLN